MIKMFKCSVCGYIHIGGEVPEKCPKCKAPKEKFVEMTAEESEKVSMSDRTNSIHMQLVRYAEKIISLCEEGIDINLDPPCVALFKDAKEEALVIKQRSKAEMAGHMGKGKW